MTEALLDQAQQGDPDAFERLVEPYRHELLLHCYRMAGTLQDAEDLLQDTLLRAWLALNRYEARASMRTWLYKIATNVCLDHLKSAPIRRLVPVVPPMGEHDMPSLTPDLETVWIDPLPDAWWVGIAPDPEAAFSVSESVSLAFMTVIQNLPPRQRAMVVLCDVLNFSASEAALFLNTTESAVKSALARARRTLTAHDPAFAPPLAGDERQLLDQYLAAWTTHDIPKLLQLINHDAIITMPPMGVWYQGASGVARFLGTVAFGDARARYQMQAVRASGQPAVATYNADGSAFCLQVLTLHPSGIGEIDFFIQPRLFAAFGLPLTMPPGAV